MASTEEKSEYKDWLFTDFTLFLAEKYQDNRDYDWSTLINLHEIDDDKVKTFFSLLNEFYSLNDAPVE